MAQYVLFPENPLEFPDRLANDADIRDYVNDPAQRVLLEVTERECHRGKRFTTACRHGQAI